MRFSLVVAADSQNGIGKNGSLPWTLKGDMAFFKKLTSSNEEEGVSRKPVVIMGRKTWESIPQKFRPLAGRENIVLSRTEKYFCPGALVFTSLAASLDYLKNCESSIYCIGGGQIYNEAIKFPTCKRIYFTQVHGIMNCDTFLTKVDEYDFTKLSDKETDNILNWTLPRSRVENDIQYEFLIYERQGNKENVV